MCALLSRSTVVHDMRGVHAEKLRVQRDGFREELKTVHSDHAQETKRLEKELEAARAKVEDVERASAVRMHKVLEGLELQHIQELDELREQFGGASAPPTHRRSRPGSVPATPGGAEPASPSRRRAEPQHDVEALKAMVEQYRVEARAEGSLTRDMIADLAAEIRGHGTAPVRDRLPTISSRPGFSRNATAAQEEAAAKQVQRRARGVAARKQVSKQRGPRRLAPLPARPSAEEEVAAMEVQRLVRGKAARKERASRAAAKSQSSAYDTPFAFAGQPAFPQSTASSMRPAGLAPLAPLGQPNLGGGIGGGMGGGMSKPVAVASKRVAPGSAPTSKPVAFARPARPQLEAPEAPSIGAPPLGSGSGGAARAAAVARPASAATAAARPLAMARARPK